mmetsp:Transcript_26797/g.41573  ORF Transcript_26797/g.41573 Transcript_26797/m.41573 type:complete len:325 (+) Transcript_26797:1020-1994(+)
MLAFAHAVYSGQFSSPHVVRPLQSSSVKETIANVSATFRFHNRPNPTLDQFGKPSLILQRQWRAYTNADRIRKYQKAIPQSVLRRLRELAQTEMDKALTDLVIGAYFFAMRSCEYSTVKEKNTRTRRLCLSNIRFFQGRRELLHSQDLSTADAVSITFEFQKNDVTWETVTHTASGDDSLCPVRAWAAVVTRVWQIPGASRDTPVNSFQHHASTIEFSSNFVTCSLCAVVEELGVDFLGFSKDDIGTHSLRSGCAMAMHLAGIPVYMMMLIGRWSSEAFMLYIQKQVRQFACGVTASMIQPRPFFTIPELSTVFTGANNSNSQN